MCCGGENSGRTYTLEGNENTPGVIFRATVWLFHTIEEYAPPGIACLVKASVCEVTHDTITDLLKEQAGVTHHVRDDKAHGFVVSGLSNVLIRKPADILAVKSMLWRNPVPGAHMVFSLTLEQVKPSGALPSRESEEPVQGSLVRFARLNFVSVCMSESTASLRLNSDARHLNNVVYALEKKLPHVPFHKSKVALLLRDALSGVIPAAMIANVSLAQSSASITSLVLSIADRSARIGKKRSEPAGLRRNTAAETKPMPLAEQAMLSPIRRDDVYTMEALTDVSSIPHGAVPVGNTPHKVVERAESPSKASLAKRRQTVSMAVSTGAKAAAAGSSSAAKPQHGKGGGAHGSASAASQAWVPLLIASLEGALLAIKQGRKKAHGFDPEVAEALLMEAKRENPSAANLHKKLARSENMLWENRVHMEVTDAALKKLRTELDDAIAARESMEKQMRQKTSAFLKEKREKDAALKQVKELKLEIEQLEDMADNLRIEAESKDELVCEALEEGNKLKSRLDTTLGHLSAVQEELMATADGERQDAGVVADLLENERALGREELMKERELRRKAEEDLVAIRNQLLKLKGSSAIELTPEPPQRAEAGDAPPLASTALSVSVSSSSEAAAKRAEVAMPKGPPPPIRVDAYPGVVESPNRSSIFDGFVVVSPKRSPDPTGMSSSMGGISSSSPAKDHGRVEVEVEVAADSAEPLDHLVDGIEDAVRKQEEVAMKHLGFVRSPEANMNIRSGGLSPTRARTNPSDMTLDDLKAIYERQLEENRRLQRELGL